MNESQDPLNNLRDIHLPEPVSFWPPAIGWWGLVAIVVLALLAGYWAYKKARQPDIRKDAHRELEQLVNSQSKNPSPHQFYIEMSVLIRRIAISVFGRERVAGLTDEKWLRFLDETAGTTFFTSQSGRLLITLPYCQHKNMKLSHDQEPLLNEIKKWINKIT